MDTLRNSTRNRLPKDKEPNIFRLLQRLAATQAAFSVFEGAKVKEADKFAECKAKYLSYVPIMLQELKSDGLISSDFTAEDFEWMYLGDSKKAGAQKITGKQIFETHFAECNLYVKSTMFPVWSKVMPKKLPSGTQIDELILRFRQELFEEKFNKIVDVAKVINDGSPTTRSACTSDSGGYCCICYIIACWWYPISK